MTAKTQKKNIWWAQEANYASRTGSRPAAASFLAVPAVDLGELGRGRTVIAGNVSTGRTGPSPNIAGPELYTLPFGLNVIGFPAAVGAAASPPAEDYFDQALGGFNRAPTSRDGQAITSLAGTTLTLGTDTYSEGDLIYLTNTDGEGEWVVVATDNADGSYELAWAPTLDPAPTLAQGSKQWIDTDGDDSSGTFEVVYSQDGNDGTNGKVWSLLGSRITSASIAHSPTERPVMTMGLTSDSRDGAGGAALFAAFSVGVNGDPAVIGAVPPITACVFINGIETEVASTSLDLGIAATPQPSTCEASGRSNYRLSQVVPSLTVQPLYSDTLEGYYDAQTQVPVLIQYGTGTGSVAVYIPAAQVDSNAGADTNDLQAQTLTFGAKTLGAGNRYVIARA